MPLNEFQNSFKTLMLDTPDALNTPPSTISEALVHDDIPLPARLGVYRNNIVSSLSKNLISKFPIVEKLVGAAFMKRMVFDFIRQHPPRSGCLNIYGQEFSAFIETFEPVRSLPYLSDCAALDFARTKAYYAPDDIPLNAEILSQIPPDDLADMSLPLRHSVSLLRSSYPLTAIREFCLTNKEPPLDLDQGGETLMVCRPGIDIQTVTLETPEFDFLSALQKRHSMGEAIERTLQTHDDFNLDAVLLRHVKLETFSAHAIA